MSSSEGRMIGLNSSLSSGGRVREKSPLLIGGRSEVLSLLVRSGGKSALVHARTALNAEANSETVPSADCLVDGLDGVCEAAAVIINSSASISTQGLRSVSIVQSISSVVGWVLMVVPVEAGMTTPLLFRPSIKTFCGPGSGRYPARRRFLVDL